MEALRAPAIATPLQTCASSSCKASKRSLSLKTSVKSVRSSRALSLQPRYTGVSQGRIPHLVTKATAGVGATNTASTWTSFELGLQPVWWQPAVPKPGETMTVYYNNALTNLEPEVGDFVKFNGGFNGPFMCGGEPRPMAIVTENPTGGKIYSVRVKIPQAAQFLQVSFTDGVRWDESYTIHVEQPASVRNNDKAYFDQLLEKEMGREGACAEAIFPDPAPVPDRCVLPGGVGLVGQSCELDLVPGCLDPASPNYDPAANVDNDSCEI